MGGVQMIDGMVITPRIVGRSVGLAPLEVILTMMAAGSLFNFLGVLLAVPIGAVAKILIQRAVKWYLGSEFYAKPPVRETAPGTTITTMATPLVRPTSDPPPRVVTAVPVTAKSKA